MSEESLEKLFVSQVDGLKTHFTSEVGHITDRLDNVETQVKDTNGKVKGLLAWKFFVQGALWALGAVGGLILLFVSKII